MEYLANPFNHSVRSFSNDGICGILNFASLNLFYYIIYVIGSKLKEIQTLEEEQEDVSDIPDILDIPDIPDIPDMFFKNVFNDETVDVKIKQDLTSLLERNSLDRHYILYYIFKKRGSFYDGESDINTYAYYKTVANEWMNFYFAYDNLILKMNLEENLENNYQFVINDLIYDCNVSHVRFLSWLYYSGIYSYLMDNQYIRKTVLDDMNTKKLLTSNLFLKYQLYLIEMENTANKVIEQEDNILPTTEQENQSQSQSQSQIDEVSDIDTNDLIEASSVDDKEENNSKNEINDVIEHYSDNEDELNNRSISEDLSNINEMTFAYKLLITVKNITIRTLIGTWKIIREEASELLHPVLG